MKRLLASIWPSPAARAKRAIERGLGHESGGDLAAAESEYRRALAIDAKNHDANYLLGSIMGRLGHLDEACKTLEAFLAGNPGFAPARRDYALALHAAGLHREAIEQYRHAIALDPSDPVPSLNLAAIYRENGCTEQAEETLRVLLGSAPGSVQALSMLAAILVDSGRAIEAVHLLSGAFERRPDADLAFQLGAACQSTGDTARARAAFEGSIALAPSHARSLHALGRIALREGDPRQAQRWLRRACEAAKGADVLRDLGEACLRLREWDEARHCLERALAGEPGNPVAMRRLALVEYNCARYEEADLLYRRLIERDPADAKAFSGRGRSLQQMGRFEEAAACYRRALELNPDLREAVNNLGTVLQETGQFEAAVAHFQRAVERLPDFTDATSNLGLAYLDLGRTADAIACFEDVLRRDPGLDEARFNRAVALLRSGDYARGWDDYESRWGSRFAVQRPFHFPEWDGGPVAGRRLLVYAEQGLGDQIMFSSCIPDLTAAGAGVVLECSPKLESLFARSFPGAEVVSSPDLASSGRSGLLSGVDCQIASGSLPLHFRRDRQAFPQRRAYLRADATRVAYWRERLDALGSGPKVGLSWRGGAVRTRRRLRSLSLEAVLRSVNREGIQFVSLQYTDCAAEISQVNGDHGLRVHHWQEAIDDYDETAALVTALDAVVTVCTSIVHLCGGLGQVAYVMVPYSPEWRYGDSGDRMPWYPSVRLIRQPAPGDWDSVLQAVSERIGEVVQRKDWHVLA